MNKHFQELNTKLWRPGRDLAIDEHMQRFTGRAREVTTVPNKPTPTGLKIWCLAQRGFLLKWVWHRPGQKNGPIGIKTPRELGGTKNGKGGNKTQAVVIHLLDLLPPSLAPYHVYLDNLFTSTKLLEMLRKKGYTATGTCRTTSGVLSELVELKKKDKGEGEMPWGTLYAMPTASNQVNQIGWKDNAFALIMSTYWEADTKVLRVRKRPKLSSSKAKTARLPFGDQSEKEMWIPEVYDAYNHNMGAVDVADQLQGHNQGLRRIRRGGGQAVDQFLLSTVLCNCYLLSLYSNWDEIGHWNQDNFRVKLVEALLVIGTDGKVPCKRLFPHTDSESFQVPLHHHSHVKMPTRKDCTACKGGQHSDRPLKRVALSEVASNLGRSSNRRTSHWGCKECKVALCREGSCFERYHGNG